MPCCCAVNHRHHHVPQKQVWAESEQNEQVLGRLTKKYKERGVESPSGAEQRQVYVRWKICGSKWPELLFAVNTRYGKCGLERISLKMMLLNTCMYTKKAEDHPSSVRYCTRQAKLFQRQRRREQKGRYPASRAPATSTRRERKTQHHRAAVAPKQDEKAFHSTNQRAAHLFRGNTFKQLRSQMSPLSPRPSQLPDAGETAFGALPGGALDACRLPLSRRRPVGRLML